MEPLSQAELLDVLQALEAAVEVNPALARTPLFLGTMRLALSARAAAPVVTPPVAAPSLEVALLASARAQLAFEIEEKGQALAKVDVASRVVASERAKAAALQKAALEAGERMHALQTEVDRLKAALADQEAERTAAAAAQDRAFAVVRGYEWASKNKIVYKGATREVPACPGCGGLQPDGLPKGTKEAGHRDKCWYHYILRSLSEPQA